MKVIGLISGTSIDGIDAALVEITGQDLELEIQLLNAQIYNYPASLKNQIIEVCHGKPLSMAELARLDDAIASQFAIAASKIQKQFPTAELIGSHGQTVYHRPPVLRNEEQGTRNEEIERQQSGEVGIQSSSSSKDIDPDSILNPPSSILPPQSSLLNWLQYATGKGRGNCQSDRDSYRE